MPSNRVLLAQIEADLAEAEQRRHDLSYSYEVACLNGTDPSRIEVALARVNAQIVELEERRDELAGAPANDVAPAHAPAAPASAPPVPAHAAELPEFLTPKEAAALARTTVKGLEGLRRRKKGPPYTTRGKRRILYPRDEFRRWLQTTVRDTVQGEPSKPRDGI